MDSDGKSFVGGVGGVGGRETAEGGLPWLAGGNRLDPAAVWREGIVVRWGRFCR